jgi:hypothetical protein
VFHKAITSSADLSTEGAVIQFPLQSPIQKVSHVQFALIVDIRQVGSQLFKLDPTPLPVVGSFVWSLNDESNLKYVVLYQLSDVMNCINW